MRFTETFFACNFARARRTSCTCFHVCVASVSLAEDRVVLFCRHITSIPFFFLVSHLGRFLQCGFWEEGDTPCYSSVCGSGCTRVRLFASRFALSLPGGGVVHRCPGDVGSVTSACKCDHRGVFSSVGDKHAKYR